MDKTAANGRNRVEIVDELKKNIKHGIQEIIQHIRSISNRRKLRVRFKFVPAKLSSMRFCTRYSVGRWRSFGDNGRDQCISVTTAHRLEFFAFPRATPEITEY